MDRRLFLPDEMLEDIAELFALSESELRALTDIVIDPANKTPVDSYLAIVNLMGLEDEEASELFSTYQYIVYSAGERRVSASALVDEISSVMAARDSLRFREALMAVQTRRKALEALLDAASYENLAAKKKFFSSQLYNSVAGLHAICDIVPVFNRPRDSIEDYVRSIYFEVTVTNSTGELDVIALSFDDTSFALLKKEIEKMDQKIKIVDAQIAAWLQGAKQNG